MPTINKYHKIAYLYLRHMLGHTGFDLTFWNAVVKIFFSDLSFNDLMLGVEGRKLFYQIVPNQLFSIVTENKFFVWNYLFWFETIWKFKWFFSQYIYLYPTIVIIKTWNTYIECYWSLVGTRRNVIKTFHVKIIKALSSYK